jgi:hypothetical protein
MDRGLGGFPMAVRENGFDGETHLVHHPPSVRAFLDRAAKPDQRRSASQARVPPTRPVRGTGT